MFANETQLTLRLSPQEIYHLDNFYFTSDELKSVVDEFCQMQQLHFLYLWGATGTGKTHLLIAIAEKVQQMGVNVMYVSLAELNRTSQPEALQQLEHADLLCLDDLEAVAGNNAWEEALFHCFNRLHSHGSKLLVATNHNPVNTEFLLPDLRSRLATGLTYQLDILSDKDKQSALIAQAQSRGLSLSDEVAQYLLRHYGRDMPSLMSRLQLLDKASLQAQRRLTIPFVKQVLQNG